MDAIVSLFSPRLVNQQVQVMAIDRLPKMGEVLLFRGTRGVVFRYGARRNDDELIETFVDLVDEAHWIKANTAWRPAL